MPRKLTPQSSLENLKKEAKRWLKALRANDAEARARLERAWPKAPAKPGLRDLQRAVAIEHGLDGWTALKNRLAEGVPADTDRAETVATFLRNAALDWGVGGSTRISLGRTAERILRRHPDMARDSLYTAVVCGDLEEVERRLAKRPEAASEKGGPRDWPPLLYLCSTRLSLPAASDNAVAIARALLDRGADPNAFYPGGSESIHYTALTCVAGEGEEDAPPHPRREALWQLLLERGAEPYDIQTLYNTHFRGDVLWFLKLMYAQAVKLGRKSDWDDPTWKMLDMGGYGCGARYLLGNAVERNDVELVEWILAHGASADPPASPHPRASKRTVHEEALRRGHTEIAELLVRHGATPSAIAYEGVEGFAAACFRLDRDAAQSMLAAHPEYLRDPLPLFAAAKRDRADVVAFLLDLGMSVDVEDAHGTRALHEAAYGDAPRVVALLIERGAEIDARETQHGNTPLGHAVYGKRHRTIELLSRVSRDFFELVWIGKLERVRELVIEKPERARIVSDGETPLMWLPDDDACALETAKLLLASGADPTLRNGKGSTAADFAEKRGLYEVAELLRSVAPESATSTHATAAPAAPILASYSQLAEDIVLAYRSGDPAALQRIQDRTQRKVTLNLLRAGVKQALGMLPDAENRSADISLADAQLLVARWQGASSWLELEERAVKPANDRVASHVDWSENKIRLREPLRPGDEDALIALMKEQRITGLAASGQMTDALLARIAEVDHLTRLDLSGSERVTDEGLRHLARLPRLQHLDLSGCRITDRGLEVLRQLSELRTFHLCHQAGISDAGVVQLAHCEHLEHVDLMGTPTGDGAIRALTRKPRLRRFLAGSNVSDAGLLLFHEFPVFKTWQGGDVAISLMEFAADPNTLWLNLKAPFTNAGLAHLAGLDGLFALNLFGSTGRGPFDDRRSKVSADGLRHLVNLSHLGWLGCGARLGNDEALQYISEMPRLRMLSCQDAVAGNDGFVALSRSSSIEYIWGRRCHNLRARGFAALSAMPALRGLSVSCKNVNDAGLSALPRFPALREFMPMDVPDAGFRHVGRCERLEALECMYCTNTTDAATDHIAGLTQLKRYRAWGTRITDRSLEILGRMTSIEQLLFAQCARITNAGLAFLVRLPRLREIELDGMPRVTANGVAAFPASVRVKFAGQTANIAERRQKETRMIQPAELASEKPYGPWESRGCDVWDALSAAKAGDVPSLRRLLARDPNLARYSQPIHFAAREGRLDAVRVLLDAGADPDERIGTDDLATVARDRGHDAVARLLEQARSRRARATPAVEDHTIHVAAAAGDVARVRALVDVAPELVHRSDRKGATPLHRAVAASAREVIDLLLDRGANIHAAHGAGPGSEGGYAPVDFQPIDLALWGRHRDVDVARLLIARGASVDLAIAAALGDIDRVRRFLDDDPKRIAEARPSGRRALSAAVEIGHEDIVRLLLERGADPNASEGADAPRGMALHVAARAGNRRMVELLLAHGADPNSHVESAGNATYAARTPELRALLFAHGGMLDTYDLVWLGEDDEVLRRVAADPSSANAGCGGVFTAACTLGKRDLVVRLLAAGARVPPVATGCRTYLMSDPELFRLLLASGMNPDMPDWQLTTPLHDLCGRDGRGRPLAHRVACATILLDAGATISAKDEEYRSTPLGWAARNDLPDMVELLLARGAPTNLPDDEPWATPLAWATRRGHGHVAEILRKAGATR